MISYPMKQQSTDKTITFTLKIDSKDLNKEYQKLVKNASAQVSIKGFRPGKAPLELVEKELSPSKIYQQIIQNLLPPLYENYIKDNKYNPIIRPQINLTNPPLSLDKDWQFEIKTCQKPQVILANYLPQLKLINKQKYKDTQAHNQKIIDLLTKKATISMPQILVDTQVKDKMVQLIDSASSAGLTLKQYLDSKQTNPEDYQKSLAQNIETEWKISLALDEIATKNKIDVSQADIDKAIPQDKNNPDQANLFYYLLKQQKTLDYLRNQK